jgi:mannose/fructose/N-acetylgalactosamine-specific phosphotransferase system component IID
MQNLGLLSALLPFLRGRPRNLNQDRLFCRRYYEFFNTNPYFANFLVGGLLRLENEMANGVELPTGTTAIYRDSLGRTLASLGDQLFWLGLRPALIMALCLMGLHNWQTGILVTVTIFAFAQLWLRWWTLGLGYSLGLDIVQLLGRPHWHRAITWMGRLAMLMTGLVGGFFLARVSAVDLAAGKSLVWAGVLLGVGLPLVLRKRLPGEGLLVVALVLALFLSFAIWPLVH